ncbi:hypothetical protein CPC08DRAFT_705291 [Agrocybe pediades]|nr:hypothetical protein CPC08DRAFT_705291 [Agrocybe pediades]
MPKAKANADSSTEYAERRYTKTSLEHFERLGWGKLARWKGRPHIEEGGYDPVKRKVIKNVSEYDPAKWGTPEFSAEDKGICMTKDIQKFFCLNKDDIVDLCYKLRSIPNTYLHKTFISHDYLCSELERRAWEKYGGPKGLEAERKKKAVQAARKKAKAAGTNPDDAAQQVQVKPLSHYRQYLPTTEPMTYPTSDKPKVVPSVLRDDQPVSYRNHVELVEVGYDDVPYEPYNEDGDHEYDEREYYDDCECCNKIAMFFNAMAQGPRGYSPPVAPRGVVAARPGTSSGTVPGPPGPAEEAEEEMKELINEVKEEDEAKPDFSAPESKPVISSTSSAVSVKQEVDDQKPVVLEAATPTTAGTRRSSRIKAQEVGVKRELEPDLEPGIDDNDGDFVPGRGNMTPGSRPSKKRKTQSKSSM